ncbi:helix-turn-helix domain-containing protein [Mangrovibacterium lignilyticum]|uniref:helix-turn-helix domain-containing protein n=1 Tax=Mangrovibacterium lignilyticum TaxID=2668052 RepID=UPI0013D1AF97|nr:helix-turn-helix transcriptional regulator [Mangrovibacterium lignilyticum]
MNIRIKQIMDYKQISSSELADTIGVQRSNVTHVLQGRNKPGFQFISKLLETFPDINAKWLITGQGDMLIGDVPKKADLFDSQPPKQEPEQRAPIEDPPVIKEEKQAEVINSNPPTPEIVKSMVPPLNKEIERIVVFYTDQTFKQYLPSN